MSWPRGRTSGKSSATFPKLLYFTTPHFDGHPAVLVRLAEIGVPELQELLTEGWLAQAPKTLAREFLENR